MVGSRPREIFQEEAFKDHTPELQAKPYAKVTGAFSPIRQSYRQNHTPKLQAQLTKTYAGVIGPLPR
jgi:hypothetical protein